MNNIKVREAMRAAGIKQWELAELLNMNEFSLSRKFRHELPEEEQERIIKVIFSVAEIKKRAVDK